MITGKTINSRSNISIIDTFDGQCSEPGHQCPQDQIEKDDLKNSIDQLNKIVSQLNKGSSTNNYGPYEKSTNHYDHQDLKQNYKIEIEDDNMTDYNKKILDELRQLRKELHKNQQQKQPIGEFDRQQQDNQMKKLSQLNNIEMQLQRLMHSNIISDKKNQLQLFQLIKTFQQLKNDISLKLSGQISQTNNGNNCETIKPRLNMLDMQLKNAEKMCLHAPNIFGYVSDGQNRVGLIDKSGYIDYINNFKQQQKPYYIALRNTRNRVPPMMLPAVVEYINRPEQKNHELIGQVVDSTQKLSVGLIMKNVEKQYLILIQPVPKLPEVPVLAVTLTHEQKSTTTGNRSSMPEQRSSQCDYKSSTLAPGQKCLNGLQSSMPEQRSPQCDYKSSTLAPGQKCLNGLQSSVYQGNIEWTQTNSSNGRKINQQSTSTGQQLSSTSQHSVSIGQQSSSIGQQSSSKNQAQKGSSQSEQQNIGPYSGMSLSSHQFSFLDNL
jgi:hypothetical protein